MQHLNQPSASCVEGGSLSYELTDHNEKNKHY